MEYSFYIWEAVADCQGICLVRVIAKSGLVAYGLMALWP